MIRAERAGGTKRMRWAWLFVIVYQAFALGSAASGADRGTGWAWGENRDNELDDWTSVDRHVPVPMRDLRENVTAFAGGYNYTLALKSDSTVWAWGANDDGQLGNGRTNTVLSPIQVFSNARAIAAGMVHSLALKSDGTVWAWGNNVHGTLGDGTRTRRTSPVQVTNLANVSAIAAGESHSLALKADGTVWTWGANDNGQIGDGLSSNSRVTPVQVPNLTGVKAIAAGANHNLVVKDDGTVWAWGDGSNGDLGDGTRIQRTTPVQVRDLTGVTAVAGGGSHSLALKSDGTVWAWGYKLDGSTFDSNNFSTTPWQVPDLADVTAIASGSLHNLALIRNRSVRAWGQNSWGQLGDDTTAIHRTPVAVRDLTDVVAVAAGAGHSLAITTESRSTPIDACRLLEWKCSPEPRLKPGSITLQCDVPNCIVIDRVPQNCLSKYRCPGCVPGGMCPPVYEMTFEGVRDIWTVGLVDADGNTVPHDVTRTRNGIVLRFRPSRDRFMDGRIGDYILVFQMSPKGIPGVAYELRTGLKVGTRDPVKR